MIKNHTNNCNLVRKLTSSGKDVLQKNFKKNFFGFFPEAWIALQ